MKQPTLRLLFFSFSILLSSISFAQNIATISGYLTDQSSGEALIFANIYIKNTTTGVTTNEYGFYSIDIPPSEEVVLVYSYIGYELLEKTVQEATDKTLNVALSAQGAMLETVEVVAEKVTTEEEEIQSTQMSTVTLPVEEIKTIPNIGGEVDIIKVVQLLPGVTKGGEGSTGMFVRGGDADQNLVLLDEATVYNISHLFGFFSVFNPDAIKDISLIKGAFPGNYGGRLSSVLDIRMKEGNNQQFHGEGGIGLLSSRLTLQGPILKNKASFLLSGRRTYVDQVMKAVGIALPYYFYDFNAKLNYTISDKDRLFFSSYFGDDVLAFDQEDLENNGGGEEEEEDLGLNFGFNLGNFTQTLRWNHIYNPKLFSNFSLIHTSFNYDIEGDFLDNSVLVKSEIRDFGGKFDFTKYQSEKTKYKFGMHLIYHRFRPNIVSASGEITDFIRDRKGVVQGTLESALYGNAEFEVNDKLKTNIGLRLSGANAKNKFYFNVEPRVAATYVMSKRHSFKASYSRMTQYMHLVSSSTVALPTDLWYPVSEGVKPQSSDQIAIAYERYLPKADVKLSVEAYYKWMRNLIEYREGSNLILNDNFENLLLQGKGQAYGLEFLLRRSKGRFNGWLAYSLSWSHRDFDELNGGKRFWAKYDRRHTFSAVLNYNITRRMTFSAVWEYISGARFTPLVAQYLYPNASLSNIEIIPIYTERNKLKLSNTHRLDVNLVFRNKTSRKFKSEFHIGAYNLYNRAMPFRVSVVLDEETGGLKYEQPGLFGFIPSIAWNFQF